MAFAQNSAGEPLLVDVLDRRREVTLRASPPRTDLARDPLTVSLLQMWCPSPWAALPASRISGAFASKNARPQPETPSPGSEGPRGPHRAPRWLRAATQRNGRSGFQERRGPQDARRRAMDVLRSRTPKNTRCSGTVQMMGRHEWPMPDINFRPAHPRKKFLDSLPACECRIICAGACPLRVPG